MLKNFRFVFSILSHASLGGSPCFFANAIKSSQLFILIIRFILSNLIDYEFYGFDTICSESGATTQTIVSMYWASTFNSSKVFLRCPATPLKSS